MNRISSAPILWSLTALVPLLLTVGGCSSDENGNVAASGGAQASGGMTSSSGGASSGGASSAGGAAATGGALGSGGSSSGGASASGGGSASGGAAGSGGNDGSGGATDMAYQPCPETGACKILPLGDSITYGMSDGSSMPAYKGAYRTELFHLALADGHEISFVGTQMPNGPQMVDGVTFPQGHEGISGQTIAQIAARVPTPALTDMPHIVLIHAGTNDTYGTDPAGAPARLEALVDKLIMAAPDALLVVATIVPYNPQAANIALINDSVQPLVTARAAAGAHVIMVDQFVAFPSNGMSSDGVHPNQTGYEQMGQVWYEAIEEYLR